MAGSLRKSMAVKDFVFLPEANTYHDLIGEVDLYGLTFICDMRMAYVMRQIVENNIAPHEIANSNEFDMFWFLDWLHTKYNGRLVTRELIGDGVIEDTWKGMYEICMVIFSFNGAFYWTGCDSEFADIAHVFATWEHIANRSAEELKTLFDRF